MRVTTGSVLRNYQTNLNKAMNNMENARMRALTQRKYMRASEDPASASKANKIKLKYWRNETYQRNLDDAQSKLDVQEGAMTDVISVSKKIKDLELSGINGTKDIESRKLMASSLREYQNTLVKSLNTTFGDQFVFGGAETAGAPFVLNADGKLTYRGIDVNSTDPADMAKLEALSKEKRYTDLGLGLEMVGGVINESTAHDVSVPGINVLGFGNTADGISKNLVTLVGQMASELEKEPMDDAKFQKISTQFVKNYDQAIDSNAKIGTKAEFLTASKTRLEDYELSLTTQLKTVESLDPAEAYTEFSWAEYAYQAALKAGTSVIGPSLIDFMT